jgi:DivIVA domain-containing protein
MDALSTQIASRSFDTVKRGYDTAAVDSYLAKLGDQVGKLEDEVRVARKHIQQLEHRAKDASAADTVVRTAFLAAAESKAKLIEEAEAKARQIIAAAEAQAAQVVQAQAGAAGGSAEVESLLNEARRKLDESERAAAARREQAEREAAEIIAVAEARVARSTATGDEGASGAADELSRLVATLGSLKEAARQGLEQAATLEADIESVIAER